MIYFDVPIPERLVVEGDVIAKDQIVCRVHSVDGSYYDVRSPIAGVVCQSKPGYYGVRPVDAPTGRSFEVMAGTPEDAVLLARIKATVAGIKVTSGPVLLVEQIAAGLWEVVLPEDLTV